MDEQVSNVFVVLPSPAATTVGPNEQKFTLCQTVFCFLTSLQRDKDIVII